MIIKKIELENFTSYEGNYIFEFDNQKRFNLIGGENGNGKTSLLKAIVFGFYGPKMFDSNIVTNNYHNFIMATLNNNTRERSFKVVIDFEYNNLVYKITRKITISKKDDKFTEQLTIIENGKEVKECSFLNEYTKDVIELFFFNGETILEIVKGQNFIKYINQLIEVSFNLSTFIQLQKDVEKSISNDYKELSSEKYEVLEKSINSTEKSIEQTVDKINRTMKQIKEYNLNLDALQAEMRKNHVLDDDVFKQKTTEELQVKERITMLKTQLDQFRKMDLNNLLIHKISSDVSEKLERTRDKRIKQMVENYEQIGGSIKWPNLINFNLEHDLIIKNNQYSDYNYQEIIKLIKQITKTEKQLIKIRKELATSEEGRRHINTGENISFYESEIGRSEEQLNRYEQDKSKLEEKLTDLRTHIEEEKKTLLKNSLQSNAINEKNKLTNVVEEYIRRHKQTIYQEINQELNRVLNSVFRKEDLIQAVKLTEENLEIKQKNKRINFEQFSAGEQQMLIVGVILAIIKASKNNNPLVLDTFIGRLDSSHTKNVLNYLRDEIDNQILILTTDKEITVKEYKLLADEINNQYTLTNNGYKTVLLEGYFNYENKNK